MNIHRPRVDIIHILGSYEKQKVDFWVKSRLIRISNSIQTVFRSRCSWRHVTVVSAELNKKRVCAEEQCSDGVLQRTV